MNNYYDYINSSEWRKKRKERLELDGQRCRLCDSEERLEVHHRPSSYSKIPNESVKDDLITICKHCHDLVTNKIRKTRYMKRTIEPKKMEKARVSRKELSYGLANIEIPTEIRLSNDPTQRTNGGSNKQICTINEGDYIQTKQDRRGL